jgi:ABC-type Fe3+-siderophore transport system permease subunit
MVRLTRRQRDVLADKLPQAGNVGMGVLVFSQLGGQQVFSPYSFGAGIVMWIVSMAFGLIAAGGEP